MRTLPELSLTEITENQHVKKAFETTPLIVAAILTGFMSYFYSRVFFNLEEKIASFYSANPWYASLLVTVVAIFLSWWIPYRFARHAIGSGVPQMLAANELLVNRIQGPVNALVGLKTIVVKFISSIVCAAGGGAVGQEGPTLQIASGIFYVIGERGARFFRESSTKFLVLVGGAAGMAAAFNTPLGGIAYALEELSKEHFNKIKTNMILAVIAAGLCVQTVQGSYLYFGYPRIEPIQPLAYLIVVVVAIAVGFLGAMFGKLMKKVYLLREKYSLKKLIALNVGLGLSFWAMAFFLSDKMLGSGKHQIMGLLFRDEHSSIQDILGRFIGPLMMMLAGTAGGLFAPSLSIGAVSGSLLGDLLWSHSHNLLVLVGMISFMVGFMRTPFTAFILVLEMTDRHSALLPMMMASLVAYGVAKIVDSESFYDFVKERILTKLTPPSSEEKVPPSDSNPAPAP